MHYLLEHLGEVHQQVHGLLLLWVTVPVSVLVVAGRAPGALAPPLVVEGRRAVSGGTVVSVSANKNVTSSHNSRSTTKLQSSSAAVKVVLAIIVSFTHI